jgi:hypothetical protein
MLLLLLKKEIFRNSFPEELAHTLQDKIRQILNENSEVLWSGEITEFPGNQRNKNGPEPD